MNRSNGWYMNTEIGRNLAERYDVLPQIAEKMGLDNKVNASLWQDKALLELNIAILHSYQKAGVTMVDHHTASKQFLMHDKREKEAGRECPALWSWVVPPLSSSLCPVWHHQMRYFEAKPNYFYQVCEPIAFAFANVINHFFLDICSRQLGIIMQSIGNGLKKHVAAVEVTHRMSRNSLAER